MTRRHPRLRRLAVALCSLLVLAAAAWTLWNYRASTALERAIASLAAAGLPLSAAQVQPAEPPPEENAAPLFKAAFALLHAAPAHVHDIDVDLDDRPGLPDGAQEAVAAASEALELVHRAVLKPRCNFQLNYEKGISMEMGHLHPLRRLARLLAARAVLRAEAGDLTDAAGDVRAVFAMARALREEPILVSQLVRVSIDAAALRALELVLPRLESAPAALDAMAPDAARGAIALALRGEIAIVALGVLDSNVLDNIDSIVGPIDGAWILRLGRPARPYLKADLARLLALLQSCAQIAARPYAESLPAWKAATLEGDRQGGLLVRLFSSHFSGVLLEEATLASRVELARLAALFIEHRRQHGDYPNSIGALATKAPEDPLTAKPFVLRQEEGAVVLASEGDSRVVWRLQEK